MLTETRPLLLIQRKSPVKGFERVESIRIDYPPLYPTAATKPQFNTSTLEVLSPPNLDAFIEIAWAQVTNKPIPK